jgi:hypothetical protein
VATTSPATKQEKVVPYEPSTSKGYYRHYLDILYRRASSWLFNGKPRLLVVLQQDLLSEDAQQFPQHFQNQPKDWNR